METTNEKRDYKKEARDFLTKNAILFKIEFLGKGTAKWDDKNQRNMYNFIFWKHGNDQHKEVSFVLYDSIHNTQKNIRCKEPYDILAGITKYDPDTFENFCYEFGYSTDSRSALETYLGVQEEWNKVRGFFTAEELEELREIN